MLVSLFFRWLRIMITSVICSLPIYLQYVGVFSNRFILVLSFIAFAIVTGIDAYRFSSLFWKKRAYYLGQLLPLGIYCFMGILTCLIFPPAVFNRIFLPLRVAGCLGMNTIESVIFISIAITVMVTGLRFVGAISGRSNHNMFVRENDDI